MPKNTASLVPLFEALSDENRLKILKQVKKRSLKCALQPNGKCNQACIKDLEKKLKISMPTVSYHVKLLENAGLLNTRKEGRFLYLEVSEKEFRKISEFIKMF